VSKNELLEEFAKLTPAERDEIWEALCALEEQRALGTPTPSEEEMALLDRETEEFENNPQVGAPWAEVEARIRAIR